MEITTTSQGLRKAKQSNDYGLAVVKGKKDGSAVVIKNRRAVGTFMASDRGFFRQMFAQEKVTVSTFDEGIEMADQWLATIEREVSAELSNVINSLQAQALDKNYKPGWVFYRMKDFYRSDLATKFTAPLGE